MEFFIRNTHVPLFFQPYFLFEVYIYNDKLPVYIYIYMYVYKFKMLQDKRLSLDLEHLSCPLISIGSRWTRTGDLI